MLGDAPSRNPEDRDMVKGLRIPCGPVRRIIREMFACPNATPEEHAEVEAFAERLEDGGDLSRTGA